MPDFDIAKFNSPVPGMALTAEPGSRPWEKPAIYPHAEDALTFYIDKFNSPESLNNLFDILEGGFPATVLIDSLIVTGVMEGLHTIDVGVLIAPALFQFVVGVASIAKIKHKTGMDTVKEDNASFISLAMKEQEENMTEEEDPDEPDELINIAEEGIEEMQAGLMSRPTPEQGEE